MQLLADISGFLSGLIPREEEGIYARDLASVPKAAFVVSNVDKVDDELYKITANFETDQSDLLGELLQNKVKKLSILGTGVEDAVLLIGGDKNVTSPTKWSADFLVKPDKILNTCCLPAKLA